MTDSLKELFAAASELPDDDRARFVATAGLDDSMRDRLLRLLRAHDEAGGFLEYPTALVEAAAAEAAATGDGLEPGQHIGNYTLVERIGRGGGGSVWRARQERPVERTVAMKVLHADVDSGRLLARFLAERQTLARMQHPSIATVLDAGSLPDGRPWLTMALVEGHTLGEYCAARELALPARLRLFAEVCLAVQHAHGKGIVHRDLKPTNVLVVEREGRPHPVVIDFGVATATYDRPADDDQPLLGTPDYMSPEQIAPGERDVDTRTDVYSLGVLLYELVARARPFANAADRPTMWRHIRETAPLPPSRQPARLPRLPRELDWVVARAMAKAPDARYQTAAALADDVHRLLRHEPVLAAPPGAVYRLRKFARRHRLAVGAALVALLSIGIGTTIAIRGWLAATRESATANRALDLLDDLWGSADPLRIGRADYPVRELFRDFERGIVSRTEGEPTVELRLRLALGRLERTLGLPENALRHADRAVELARTHGSSVELARALLEHAFSAFERGQFESAERSARAALAACPPHPADANGPDPRAAILACLADCELQNGDRDGALATADAARELRERTGNATDIAQSLLQLARLHGSTGNVEPAKTLLQQAIDALEPLHRFHPSALAVLQHLAFIQQRSGDLEAAEQSFRHSLDRRAEAFDPDHPYVAWAKADLAWLLHERQRNDEAATLLREALPVLRQRLGEQHLFVSETMQRLGTVLTTDERLADADPFLTDAARRFRTLPGHPVSGLVSCLSNLATLRWQQGRRGDAQELQSDALAIARRELPADHFVVSVAITNLAGLHEALGELQTAATLLREALALSEATGRHGDATIQRRRLERLLERLGRHEEAAALRRAQQPR